MTANRLCGRAAAIRPKSDARSPGALVHPLIKIGAALALGGLIFACPAFAVSPPSPNTRPSLLIPVQDEENEEVWRDLRPGRHRRRRQSAADDGARATQRGGQKLRRYRGEGVERGRSNP